MAGVAHGEDLIPIPSPKEKGNSEDCSETFGTVVALIFECPSHFGEGVGGEVLANWLSSMPSSHIQNNFLFT
jgi:hypothetical protein